MKIINFVIQNFAHVAPILAVALGGILIIFERTRALLVTYPFQSVEAFFEKIQNMVFSDKISEAIALCERYHLKPISGVVKSGLLRIDQPESVIEHGLLVAVGEANEKIQLRTGFLATIANVSTLLGLFGTILGLIQSFEAVGSANPSERSALLAQGISTAMNATMFGLAVAIPCMIAYSFLMNRTNRLSGEVERSALRTLEIIKQRYYMAVSPIQGGAQGSAGGMEGGGHPRGGGMGASQNLRRMK